MKHKNNYRYPGSRPFSDSDLDRLLFFGRDDETKYLFHSILVKNLFVLFAKSGMGKTSLLNAGLMKWLRKEGFIPLVIRFNDQETPPLDTIYPAIEEAVKQGNEKVDKKHKIDYEPGEKYSLWQYFKTTAFWSYDYKNNDKRLNPVLIFDQFEEFFVNHSPENREAFITQLADIVRGRVPNALMEKFKSKGYFPYSETPPKVKIIISIREDFLGNLDEMSHAIPGILKNRFRLLPLKCQQAKEAILKPAQLEENEYIRAKGFSYAPGTVEEMLHFLCERREMGKSIKTEEVEPFQLQLLCRHLEEKVTIEAAKKRPTYIVKKKDLGGKPGMNKVLQGFYEERIKALRSLWERRKVRKLCEKGLVDKKRKTRISLEEGHIKRKYKVSNEILSQLVDNRLLRSEPRVGSIYYELSHDTFVPPILESQRQIRIRKTWIAVILLPIIVSIAVLLLGKPNFFNTIIYNTFKNIDKSAKMLFDSDLKVKNEEELDQYLNSLEIDEKYFLPLIYIKIGKSCEKEEPEKAIDHYNKAIEINSKIHDPFAAVPYIALGHLYMNQEKYDKAIKRYRKAIQHGAKSAIFYINLGCALVRTGDNEGAKQTMKKLAELLHKNLRRRQKIEKDLNR